MKAKITKFEKDYFLILPESAIQHLEINPNEDMIELKIENKILKITKSQNK